ncbi:serine hydrolase domain-containing protein [Streptomyces sp. NPDC020965]|uniref:serine hydrolase domain-containing protein n=1 Tax=Streptomyces sp. NPDC020965 TaxID=3365105 RepID=UPI0037B924AF
MRSNGRTPARFARTGAVGLVAAAVAVTTLGTPAQAAPAQAASAQTASAQTAPDPGHGPTQRAMDATVAAGIPGVTAQTQDGREVWKGTSGVGNLRTGTPRGADDRFRIASITKTFVATVLLQLEGEGKLDLDDTVERHLPGAVQGNGNDGGKITVRQLLNHTSGIFDYLADPDYAAKYLVGEGFLKNRFATLAPEYHVSVAMGHPPVFQPGARHEYSNTNYVLAGLIIEKVTGHTYEREIRQRIIKPLGLRSTTNPGNSPYLPKPSSRHYSKLYLPLPAKTYDITLMNGSQGWADGDIISSTGDLNRFFRALLRGDLLSKKQLAAMKTTVATENQRSGYGLGISRHTTSCGTQVWGHSGGIAGSLSVAGATEDGRHSIAYNLNGDWTMGPANLVEAEFCGVGIKAGGGSKVGASIEAGAPTRLR